MHARPSLSLSLLALVGALALVGCAAQPAPRFVRSADLGKLGPLAPGQPLVIQFERGDTIPLHVAIEGPFVTSPEAGPPIPLRVLRRFYLRIDQDGLRSSLDGRSFDDAPAVPGRFQIGFGATPAGTEARISIRTPTPSALVP